MTRPDWVVVRAADGTTLVRLPNGHVQSYTEEQLAGMVVEQVHLSLTAPEAVSEEFLDALRAIVGEDRWAEAMRVVAAVLE